MYASWLIRLTGAYTEQEQGKHADLFWQANLQWPRELRRHRALA